jgi:hypothetical protein
MDALALQFIKDVSDRRKGISLFTNNPFNAIDAKNGNSLQGNARFQSMTTTSEDLFAKNDPSRALDAQIADETRKQAIADGKTPLDDTLEDRRKQNGGFDDIGTFHKGLAVGLQAVAKEDADISDKDKDESKVEIVVDTIAPAGVFKGLGIYLPVVAPHIRGEGKSERDDKLQNRADIARMHDDDARLSHHEQEVEKQFEKQLAENNKVHKDKAGNDVDVNGKVFEWDYNSEADAHVFKLTVPSVPSKTSFTAVFTEAGVLLGMYPRLEDLSAMLGIKGRARSYNLGRRMSGYISPQQKKRVMYLDKKGYGEMLKKYFPDHKDARKPAETPIERDVRKIEEAVERYDKDMK